MPYLSKFLVLAALLPSAWSQITIQAVVNSASFQPPVPSGGALATVFISGLSGTPGLVVAPSTLPLPSQLAGVTVIVSGALAPILAVDIPPSGANAIGVINVQIPPARDFLPAQGYLTVSQGSPCNCSETLTPLPVTSPAGGFFADQNNFAVAQHASDYSLVTAQSPAQPGETIIVYGNDFFQVWPPPPIGFPTPSQPLFLPTTPYPGSTGYLFLAGPPVQNPGLDKGTCPPAGSLPLNVTFEGLAPGLVGVEQINFVVPANQQPGTFALYFNNATDSEGMCSPNGNSSPYVMIPVG